MAIEHRCADEHRWNGAVPAAIEILYNAVIANNERRSRQRVSTPDQPPRCAAPGIGASHTAFTD
jgi:hypothetical protein